MKKLVLFLAFSLFLSHNLFAQTKVESQNNFAKSYDYVNDFEKIFTQNQITELNTTLKSFEKKHLYKIVVITTSSIKPYSDFPEYTTELDKYLANDLKAEPTILIVVSKELRQIQIQSIDLIRYKLSDDQTKEIISNFAVPEFKKGDYYKGIEAAVIQIMDKLKMV